MSKCVESAVYSFLVPSTPASQVRLRVRRYLRTADLVWTVKLLGTWELVHHAYWQVQESGLRSPCVKRTDLMAFVLAVLLTRCALGAEPSHRQARCLVENLRVLSQQRTYLPPHSSERGLETISLFGNRGACGADG